MMLSMIKTVAIGWLLVRFATNHCVDEMSGATRTHA